MLHHSVGLLPTQLSHAAAAAGGPERVKSEVFYSVLHFVVLGIPR